MSWQDSCQLQQGHQGVSCSQAEGRPPACVHQYIPSTLLAQLYKETRPNKYSGGHCCFARGLCSQVATSRAHCMQQPANQDARCLQPFHPDSNKQGMREARTGPLTSQTAGKETKPGLGKQEEVLLSVSGTLTSWPWEAQEVLPPAADTTSSCVHCSSSSTENRAYCSVALSRIGAAAVSRRHIADQHHTS